MKKIILLIFIFNSINGYSQDTVYWKSCYKLKWDDFQGQPDSLSAYGAITFAAIKYGFTLNNDSFNFKVHCFFDKKDSWVRVKSNIGLIHEQGHFDIAELFARKLRKAFKNYKLNQKTIRQDLKNIFEQIVKERSKIDALYDKQTNFSRNEKMQVYWNKKIAQELKNLEQFAK